MRQKVLQWVYTNPLTKAIGVVLNALVGSIIGSWWITDLTSPGGGVRWSRWVETEATLAVAVYVFILIAYSAGLYVHERRLSRWADPEFRRAKMWEDCWPTVMDVTRQRIRDGKLERLSDIEREVVSDD